VRRLTGVGKGGWLASRLFPTTDMYSWLSYGNGEKGQPGADAGFFQRREFCFTLEGDIFVRYQSFKDGAELHQALRDKCARPPPHLSFSVCVIHLRPPTPAPVAPCAAKE
jgi:DNA primase catalytic subunit